MPYNISKEKRDWYRQVAARSRQRKHAASKGLLVQSPPAVNVPRLNPPSLMPQLKPNGIRTLSLFSGGGGLDLGFERAGFLHLASFDVLEVCGATLTKSRPFWKVFSGESGDVVNRKWRDFAGCVDVIHGGPPCQPFSIAGRRHGGRDARDMWPAFTSAVLEIKPAAFVAENVPGLLDARFESYVHETILKPLRDTYVIASFSLRATDFGVPQSRKRVFFVGFASSESARAFGPPLPTHTTSKDLFSRSRTMGARLALGLPDIGFDGFAPTLRSGFTGPRKTTSILNSKASQAVWKKLEIWPNGVQKNREAAAAYPPESGHFRLAIQDCALLQGFPESWSFEGAVYQAIGQIGNAVCPPVGYAVAKAVAKALAG